MPERHGLCASQQQIVQVQSDNPAIAFDAIRYEIVAKTPTRDRAPLPILLEIPSGNAKRLAREKGITRASRNHAQRGRLGFGHLSYRNIRRERGSGNRNLYETVKHADPPW